MYYVMYKYVIAISDLFLFIFVLSKHILIFYSCNPARVTECGR